MTGRERGEEGGKRKYSQIQLCDGGGGEEFGKFGRFQADYF